MGTPPMPTPTTTPTPKNSLVSTWLTPAFVLSLVTIAGIIVLIALNKVTWSDGGPLIAALAGVHVGVQAAS